jgi:metal-responsive CopG/Arc/MetJ family transcriptional regulator
MHRLNLTIDEELYEEVRAASYLEKKSISQIVRESLREYLERKKEMKKRRNLVLEADEKDELLRILREETFSNEDEFRKKFDL